MYNAVFGKNWQHIMKAGISKPSEIYQNDFDQIYKTIAEAKNNAWKQVNTVLIELYWKIGSTVSKKVENDGWGMGIVTELSKFILGKNPSVKGFSARNIWRMKQFYETYKDTPKLSAVLTEISWTNHLHIISKTSSLEEKEFYLTLAAQHRYSERDFTRIINSSTYERTMLANEKLSAVLAVFPKDATNAFKDSYVFDFINISEGHKEVDLRKALIKHLKKFLLEMGHDFSFIGEEFMVQVGNKDFRIDLLMQHRELNCLVAIELKVDDFKPEHLGKLQFYLEALDQNVKKPHENPSIGILICRDRDEEVVKYALNRNMSPAMIAKYETSLIDKKLLQNELNHIKALMNIKDKSDNDE